MTIIYIGDDCYPFTKNKHYEVIDHESWVDIDRETNIAFKNYDYKIEDDHGLIAWTKREFLFHEPGGIVKFKFISIEEWRELKLNELGI